MTMKTCYICKKQKPISQFYRDRSTPDGRQYRCKECDKAKSIKWQRESGYNSEREKSKRQESQRKAKTAVKIAVKQGKLPNVKSISCVDCGEQAQEYHHWSYKEEHWLDVIPLCITCHKARHCGWERYAAVAPNIV